VLVLLDTVEEGHVDYTLRFNYSTVGASRAFPDLLVSPSIFQSVFIFIFIVFLTASLITPLINTAN